MANHIPNRGAVVGDFQRARRQAALRGVVSRLTGRATALLSYENVRQQLKGFEISGKKLDHIPLDAIVGSAGRYQDFTRSFLPRKYVNADRWIRVKMAMTGLQGVPPIEVYRIGDVYFVQDGNHRVSVAREMGLTDIEANVTEVRTKVSLTKNTHPDELILLAEYTDFLERTRQNQLRPQADLRVTAPGKYAILLEHIDVHRYFKGIEQGREFPYDETFTDWYDMIYLPVVQLIRGRGLLRYFPERTETDLYVWMSEHREELERQLGWTIRLDAAARDLADHFDPQDFISGGVKTRVQRVLTLDENGQHLLPPQELAAMRESHVVDDLLVAINGEESGWISLDQALQIAARESADLYGLYVVDSQVASVGEAAQEIRAEFERRCQAAGISGELAIEVGASAKAICRRATWVDMVVISLTEAPPTRRIKKFGSEFRSLIRNCPRPVLSVPAKPSPMDRVLLAFDGGTKAMEALYAATYLVGWWQASLVVITVAEKITDATKIQADAKAHLEQHAVEATFVVDNGTPSKSIMRTAKEHQSNLILIGGFSRRPALEFVLGSTVNKVLRKYRHPVLIFT